MKETLNAGWGRSGSAAADGMKTAQATAVTATYNSAADVPVTVAISGLAMLAYVAGLTYAAR